MISFDQSGTLYSRTLVHFTQEYSISRAIDHSPAFL